MPSLLNGCSRDAGPLCVCLSQVSGTANSCTQQSMGYCLFQSVGYYLCTKYKIATTIINKRFTQALEDYAILDEAQEGCSRHRSTKRQLYKLHCILQEGKRDKRVSVVLYLDFKNAFNAVNHRAIFLSLEAYGFPCPGTRAFRPKFLGCFWGYPRFLG